MAKEFGLTYTDVMNYWKARGNLVSGQVQKESVEQPHYQTPAKVTPGMFVYTDGLIYPEIIKGPNKGGCRQCQWFRCLGCLSPRDLFAVVQRFSAGKSNPENDRWSGSDQ